MEPPERSYEKIEIGDLERLAQLAREDREILFIRYPRWRRLYGDRTFCVALCQGAALHYVSGKNGVKDFDVWTFYAAHPEGHFPHRRVGTMDFGPSKFGRDPILPGFIGRRVDLIGRSISFSAGANPVEAMQAYLATRSSKTARLLAEKAVVLIEPASLLGTIIWNKGTVRES